MSYFDELTRAMTLLGEDKRTIFLGQSVQYDGQRMFKSLSGVPMDKRIEMPVAEDMQMGISTGLALSGFIPVSIYPRMDFLILALNQLVNHLDKLPLMSEHRPRVIIRTSVGSSHPFNPGYQHVQDHTEALKLMCRTVRVVDLRNESEIVPAYQTALHDGCSTVLIERMSEY